MNPPTRSRGSKLAVLGAAVAMMLGAGGVLVACGGDDDADSDELEATTGAIDDGATNEGDTSPADDDDDDEAGFGDFVSGTVTLSGAEEGSYAVDDDAYELTGTGGCGGDRFGVTVQVVEIATGFTVVQLSVGVDENVDGGGTGKFAVDDMSLIAITDGDFSTTRNYDGPGTLDIVSHDPAPPDFVLQDRRMEIAVEGELTSREDGDTSIDADLVWVMGCP